jgi:hypothetical protein
MAGSAVSDWEWAWDEYGPFREEYDALKKQSQTAEVKKKKKEIELCVSKFTSIEWCYGYTKHVAYIIVKFTEAIFGGNTAESAMGTTKEARKKAFDCLKQLELMNRFNDFDTCVLPIKKRKHGTIPRAFLGSDVKESGEGLGFNANRLRRYLSHPAVVPKAELLNWANYADKGTRALRRFNDWYYSIKYDGYSAIWTGTKLVTANGRQTVYTMPRAMRDCLTAIRVPLVGELVLVQKKGAPVYTTKEALQAVVHAGGDVSRKTKEVAERMVFMVYDTPATDTREMNFTKRQAYLKTVLVRLRGGVKYELTAAVDHVELVKQMKVGSMSGNQDVRRILEHLLGRVRQENVLAAALLAATATEHEGLMLTPDKPYLLLFSKDFRRVKLKLLYTFRVRPNEEPAAWFATGSQVQTRSLDTIRPMRRATITMTDAHGDDIRATINIEDSVWFDAAKRRTDRPFNVRLARHRWGYHLVYAKEDEDTTIANFRRLIRPYEVGDLLNQLVGPLLDDFADHIEPEDLDGSIDLYCLFSSRMMHAKAMSRRDDGLRLAGGRPHYPVHPPVQDVAAGEREFGNSVDVISGTFLGETSSAEVRELVRQASMLAEQSNLRQQPYNEWLCRIHRAYESSTIELETKQVLETALYTVAGRYCSRLPAWPGKPLVYYQRDYTMWHLSETPDKHSVYKLFRYDSAPQDGPMYEPPENDSKYFLPDEGQLLESRVDKNAFVDRNPDGVDPDGVAMNIDDFGLDNQRLLGLAVRPLMDDLGLENAAVWDPKVSLNFALATAELGSDFTSTLTTAIEAIRGAPPPEIPVEVAVVSPILAPEAEDAGTELAAEPVPETTGRPKTIEASYAVLEDAIGPAILAAEGYGLLSFVNGYTDGRIDFYLAKYIRSWDSATSTTTRRNSSIRGLFGDKEYTLVDVPFSKPKKKDWDKSKTKPATVNEPSNIPLSNRNGIIETQFELANNERHTLSNVPAGGIQVLYEVGGDGNLLHDTDGNYMFILKDGRKEIEASQVAALLEGGSWMLQYGKADDDELAVWLR